MRVTFPSAEGAKLTGENADVGVINVPIENISGAVPVFSFTNDVSYRAERVDVGGPVKAACFAVVNSFSCEDLIVDRAEFLRNEPGACEIFHKLNLTQDDSRSKLGQLCSFT